MLKSGSMRRAAQVASGASASLRHPGWELGDGGAAASPGSTMRRMRRRGCSVVVSDSAALLPSVTAAAVASRRSFALLPHNTPDPDRFPEGFVPLQGDEPVEMIYDLLKQGHYICATKKLEHADRLFHDVFRLVETEYPGHSFDDLVLQQSRKQDLLQRVIVPRSFWDLADWNDTELYKSYGPQTPLYDSYAWSTKINYQFKSYVEQWFPAGEHTHLSIVDYFKAMQYFIAQEMGVRTFPLFKKNQRLKPLMGVPLPTKWSLQAAKLLVQWTEAWQGPLSLNKVLVLKSGNGLNALALRGIVGCPMVRSVDHRRLALVSARNDQRRFGRTFDNMGYRLASLFPSVKKNAGLDLDDPRLSIKLANREGEGISPEDEAPEAPCPITDELKATSGSLRAEGENEWQHKYDMVMYSPDEKFLEDPHSAIRYPFAPGLKDSDGTLEEIFEQCHKYLKDRGILVILTSNFRSLAYPDKPHTIEEEIRKNRRWVLLDYMDVSPGVAGSSNDGEGGVSRKPSTGGRRSAIPTLESGGGADGQDGFVTGGGSGINANAGPTKQLSPVMREILKKLRLELWVLHRVEALPIHGWVHGIPGAQPPPKLAGKYRAQSRQALQRRVIKERVEELGMDWGTYKDRMMKMMRDHQDLSSGGGGGENTTDAVKLMTEDSHAQSVRMLLDPTYPAELAEKSRKLVHAKLKADKEWHKQVSRMYPLQTVSEAEEEQQQQAGGVGGGNSSSIVKKNTKKMGDGELVSPRATFDNWAKEFAPQAYRRSGHYPIGSSSFNEGGGGGGGITSPHAIVSSSGDGDDGETPLDNHRSL